ncbi:hypothetical protein RB195_013065 [Necator americanus]|uniref:Uncharacterized protein n=1 Tax=Necator americanus TaxID=51031 RepID=A0ABR1DWH5_NECAM
MSSICSSCQLRFNPSAFFTPIRVTIPYVQESSCSEHYEIATVKDLNILEENLNSAWVFGFQNGSEKKNHGKIMENGQFRQASSPKGSAMAARSMAQNHG